MPTLLLTHPACLAHDTGDYHPECADRLKAILVALEEEEFMTLHREQAPQATMDHLLRAHSMGHIDYIRRNMPRPGEQAHLDPDTVISEGSWNAALHAAGAVVAAVDAVATGQCRNAFCAVRPPGHHAEPKNAMGFCLFNNVAIGALHAQAEHGLKRVAVIDIDVHHGNGTQEIFFNNPDLFYASTHQSEAYPGTGFRHETGCADNILNAPLPAGSGSEPWRHVVTTAILPRLRAFKPDLIMMSTGFDAHGSDPLAHMRLTTNDYYWVTEQLCDMARELCEHRVVSVLEGGYDLRALAMSSAAHVRALMGF